MTVPRSCRGFEDVVDGEWSGETGVLTLRSHREPGVDLSSANQSI